MKKPSLEDFLTPTEIIDHFKEVAEVWNCRQIGNLLQLGLVRGRKANKTSYIKVVDVLQLIPARKVA